MTHLESISLAMDAIFYGKKLRRDETHECERCREEIENFDADEHKVCGEVVCYECQDLQWMIEREWDDE